MLRAREIWDGHAADEEPGKGERDHDADGHGSDDDHRHVPRHRSGRARRIGTPVDTHAAAGSRVLEVFPMLPLIGNVALGVGALSYAGTFSIGIVAARPQARSAPGSTA